MTLTIVALSAAYTILGAILLLMAIRARLAWWIKAATIVVTSAFFVISFDQMRGLLGWPAVRPLPDRFQLLWTRVVEPSRAYNEAGAIYMWVEELDENNVPSGVPRAYKIRYSAPLAEKVEKARAEIVSGKAQEGMASEIENDGQDAPASPSATPDAAPPNGEQSREGSQQVDPEFLQNAPRHLDFAPLPAPLLPVKQGN